MIGKIVNFYAGKKIVKSKKGRISKGEKFLNEKKKKKKRERGEGRETLKKQTTQINLKILLWKNI